MAKKTAKGYQTRSDGHYGTLKVNGKSYVSGRFPLAMDEETLQLDVALWRATKRRDLQAEARAAAAPQRSLARDIKRFLAKLPEGRKKKDQAQLLGKWANSPLGEKPRLTITREDIRSQLDRWEKRECYSASSLNHFRQVLLTLWKELDPEATLPPCPAKTIKKWKENNVRQGFFELPQFLKVISHLPSDHADFASFAYLSGWRRGEISGLQWQEVDLTGNVIRMPGSRTKSGKPRILPLGKHLLPLIEGRKKLARESPYVFTYVGEKRFKGEVLPIKAFHKRWKRACLLAGCADALIHDFRRTAVRNMIRQRVPETVAMARTGHATRSMFDRYNIVSEADLRESAKFEDSFDFTLDPEL